MILRNLEFTRKSKIVIFNLCEIHKKFDKRRDDTRIGC